MPYKDRGKWRGVVKTGGKRVAQKLFTLKKDAAEWERQKGKELKKREQRLQGGLDLLSFCSKYLIFSERFRPKVKEEKKSVCERILKEWGRDTPVDEITVEMAEDYLLKQKQLRSANASNKERKNLHAMWQKGTKTWGVPRNIFIDIEKFPHDRQPQFTPSPDQVLKVIMAATRKERLLLITYIQTGARRSELFRWTWVEDINFDKRQYRLGTRKTRDGSMQHEWFKMSNELHEELSWWWENRPIKNSPYVFTDDQPGPHYGKPYKARRRFMAGLCMRAFDPACKSHKKYTGPVFGFHALRRFCASCLADAGKSTNAIRRLLRHKNIRTTELYIQNINDDMQDVADALETSKLFPVPQTGTPEKEKDVSESR